MCLLFLVLLATRLGVTLADAPPIDPPNSIELQAAIAEQDVSTLKNILGSDAETVGAAMVCDGGSCYPFLHWVARGGGAVKVVKWYLEIGAPTDVLDQFGYLPGETALEAGNVEIAKLLRKEDKVISTETLIAYFTRTYDDIFQTQDGAVVGKLSWTSDGPSRAKVSITVLEDGNPSSGMDCVIESRFGYFVCLDETHWIR